MEQSEPYSTLLANWQLSSSCGRQMLAAIFCLEWRVSSGIEYSSKPSSR